MITNWRKTIKIFKTFEEITKADLDFFFDKINNEKYLKQGVEWCTPQLGHFWIELRIKTPLSQAVPAKNIEKIATKNFGIFQRQESEENRLYGDNEEDERDNKKSEHSEIMERISEYSKKSKPVGLKEKSKKLLAESISEYNEEDHTPKR